MTRMLVTDSNPNNTPMTRNNTMLRIQNIRQTSDFSQMHWEDIVELSENPLQVKKEDAPAVCTHDANSRSAKEVIRHNNFTMLATDVDTGNKALDTLVEQLAGLCVESYLIYSTASHKTKGENKWRILIPLIGGIPFERWLTVQTYLAHVFEGDRAMLAPNQMSFLPNKINGEYEHHLASGTPLNAHHDEHPLIAKALDYKLTLEVERITQKTQETQRKTALREHRKNTIKNAIPNTPKNGMSGVSLIEMFNEENPVTDILEEHGYQPVGNGRYIKPTKNPNNFDDVRTAGIKVEEDKIKCYYSEDILTSDLPLDSFDVFSRLSYDNDTNRAISAAGRKCMVGNETVTQFNQRMYKQQEVPTKGPLPTRVDPENPMATLTAMKMTMAKAERFSDPDFIVPGLWIQSHLIAMVAPPGAGKTTIAHHLSKQLAQQGKQVMYINYDISASDIKHYVQEAQEYDTYNILAPDLEEGETLRPNQIIDILEAQTDIPGCDLSDTVFILDTLKKFVGMLNKEDLKAFFSKLRKISAKGGTVVMLSHTNKHKGKDGLMVFEGTGDLAADIDDVVYLVPSGKRETGVTVSTTIDGSGDARKVRGDIQPRSWLINPDRTVQDLDEYVDTKQAEKENKQLAKDQPGIEAFHKALSEGVQGQKNLVAWVLNNGGTGIGDTNLRKILVRYSEGTYQQWVCTRNGSNSYEYTTIR